MLITCTEKLKQFYTEQRIWQGIPSIAVTPRGRIFVTFYSGGTKEEIGNYAMVIVSNDGEHYSEPIAAAYLEDHRCYDPCLWIDPLGRLWFTWSVCPDDALYGSICEDPDSELLSWSEPFKIGNDIMMNKPVVLSTGEWLFPVAVWAEGIRSLPAEFDSKTPEKGSFVYKTSDNGASFIKLGGADVEKRHFDEHMVVELKDGSLMMLVRTFYGIGVSYSYDGGRSWSKGANSGLGGPSSRFHICRLKSGRLLLINHVNFTGRNNLTAMLSEDDGKTWSTGLLLDERKSVSYPDAMEGEDGYIYITYDRQRGAFKRKLQDALDCAREILVAKVSEEDILAEKMISSQGYLKRVVSKLGEYRGNDKNPYKEAIRYSNEELASMLMETVEGPKIADGIFDHYPLPCYEGNEAQLRSLDEKIGAFSDSGYRDKGKLVEIIGAVRALSEGSASVHPSVERIKDYVCRNLTQETSAADMAKAMGMSRYYMCHLFKRECGITILEYRNAIRLMRAKKRLVATQDKIGDIAYDCGFANVSYFGEIFLASEGITPSEYRKLHQQ